MGSETWTGFEADRVRRERRVGWARRFFRWVWNVFLAPYERRWIAIGLEDEPIYETASCSPEESARLAVGLGRQFMSVEPFVVIRNGRGQRRLWIEVVREVRS